MENTILHASFRILDKGHGVIITIMFSIFSRSFANMMPYMVSYMRRHSDEADPADPLTYGDFIVVQSAWGITQGCVLPVAGALVNYIGVRR